MVVSDIHYEQGNFHGIDESRAFDWILNLIIEKAPTDLIGLGDWGYAWTIQTWAEITSLVKIYTIFGNHDNLEILGGMKNTDGSPILTGDAEIRNISGVKFGFINGVITEDGGAKKGVPRKTPDQYLAIAKRLTSVDFLCTHESPLMPDSWVKPEGYGPTTARKAVEMVSPIVSLSGHMHGQFIIKTLGKTTAIQIDSSQAQRQFIVLETQKREIEIWSEYSLLQKEKFRDIN